MPDVSGLIMGATRQGNGFWSKKAELAH
jgi:hypothetical protein